MNRQLRCSDRHRSCSPWHYQLVMNYRLARHAQEEQRDILYGGTTEEWEEYTRGMITFRDWLIGMRGSNEM